jgi:hypothetical protein
MQHWIQKIWLRVWSLVLPKTKLLRLCKELRLNLDSKLSFYDWQIRAIQNSIELWPTTRKECKQIMPQQ